MSAHFVSSKLDTFDSINQAVLEICQIDVGGNAFLCRTLFDYGAQLGFVNDEHLTAELRYAKGDPEKVFTAHERRREYVMTVASCGYRIQIAHTNWSDAIEQFKNVSEAGWSAYRGIADSGERAAFVHNLHVVGSKISEAEAGTRRFKVVRPTLDESELISGLQLTFKALQEFLAKAQSERSKGMQFYDLEADYPTTAAAPAGQPCKSRKLYELRNLSYIPARKLLNVPAFRAQQDAFLELDNALTALMKADAEYSRDCNVWRNILHPTPKDPDVIEIRLRAEEPPVDWLQRMLISDQLRKQVAACLFKVADLRRKLAGVLPAAVAETAMLVNGWNSEVEQVAVLNCLATDVLLRGSGYATTGYAKALGSNALLEAEVAHAHATYRINSAEK